MTIEQALHMLILALVTYAIARLEYEARKLRKKRNARGNNPDNSE